MRATQQRTLLLLVLLAAAVLVAASDPAQALLHRVLDRARDVIVGYPIAGPIAFMVLSAVSAMLAFFSTALVVPVAIYAWGRLATLAMLWAAWLLGGMCTYVIGRTIGRRVARWLVNPDKVDFYAAKIATTTPLLTILLFQLALPSEVPGYVLGAVLYRFVKYLAVLAIAELPFAIGSVYLGDSFIRRQLWPFLLIGLLGVATSAFLLRRLHARFGTT